jgi:hypothetical protein
LIPKQKCMSNQETTSLAPEEFLHSRDVNLQKSPGVTSTIDYLNQNGTVIPNQPADKISAYLAFLRDAVNDGILTGDSENIGRQIDAASVPEEDVPEAYFNFQKRVWREQGHGDVDISPGIKRELVKIARNDQEGRLEEWAEYLTGDDNPYPDWFKYYAWESVIKLKPFNIEKQAFTRRSRGTTAPFPELNQEALAYVYDGLQAAHIDGKTLDDPEHKSLAASGNFAKLYAHAIREATPQSPELTSITEGAWTVYEQTRDTDVAERLSGSLAKRATGWCTAGKSMAARQLRGGDFHVFYTKDKNGEYTRPRIAVRMSDGQVVEVRGILPAQEVEPEFVDIALDHIKDLPGGDTYTQKVEDMRRVTDIDNRLNKDPDKILTSEEIRFLYELDRKIEGFGYKPDPRIKQIVNARDFRADMQEIGQPMDEELAQKLLDNGEVKVLCNHLDAFDTFEPEARERIQKGIMSEVRYFRIKDYIRYFGGDPMSASMGMLDSGISHVKREVIRYFDTIPGIDTAAILKHITKTAAVYLFEDRPDLVENMTPAERIDFSKTMIANGKYDDLAHHLDAFPEIDRGEFAQQMFDMGKPDIIFWNIHKFPQVDKATLAEQLMKNGDVPPVQLIWAFNKLPLDRDKVAQRLMDDGNYSAIIMYLKDFPALDPLDLLTHMVAHGETEGALKLIRQESNLYGHGDFPKVSCEEFAQRLITAGYGDLVKTNLRAFGLSNDKYFEMSLAPLPRRKRAVKRITRSVLGPS